MLQTGSVPNTWESKKRLTSQRLHEHAAMWQVPTALVAVKPGSKQPHECVCAASWVGWVCKP